MQVCKDVDIKILDVLKQSWLTKQLPTPLQDVVVLI